MNRDFAKLKEDLSAIGLKAGDRVLIHSSFKSLGQVTGGLQTLVEAVQSVIRDSGTLLVPTLTYSNVTLEHPVFSQKNTPSCVGAFSEYVRNLPDALRSVHPTHSCAALGNDAAFFTSSHYLDDTPVGENSPFFKLKESGGKLLMLGCGLRPNTSMHGVEWAFGASYLLSEQPFMYTIQTQHDTYQKAYFVHRISQNGYAQRYDRVITVLNQKFIRQGTVHGAQSYLIDAAELWKQGLRAMAKDELFFVEPKEEQ